MEKRSFRIPNISCGHCVMNIKNELNELDGITSVEGDIKKKEITVEWDSPATLEKIRSVLEEIDYPIAE